MTPALRPDDRLLVDPQAYRTTAPERGDVVVFEDPEVAGRTLIKRVAGVPADPIGPHGPVPVGSVYVLGDAPGVSRDSRAFGPVGLPALVGRAWFRYGPPGRRGPLTSDTIK